MRRRSLLTLGTISSLAMLAVGASLMACEDGPNQTFSPSLPGAENYWNNGNPDAAVSGFTGTYDGNFGAITPLQLCTADKQRQRWANMLVQPIIPGDPNNDLHPTFAGLDLAGADWGGMTYETAQGILCSGIDTGLGSDGITPVQGACFGDNCEVSFNYVPANHVIGQLDLSLGYTGYATFYSDPAEFPGVQHKYTVQLGQEIQKDGQPFELNWFDTKANETLMELYFGQMFTYGGGVGSPNNTKTPGCTSTADAIAGKCPYTSGNVWYGASQKGVPPSAYTYQKGYNCQSDQSCLQYGPNIAPALAGQCYFGIRPLLSYWNFNCETPLQPGVSTVDHFYYDFGKVLPTAHLATNLEISLRGPTTHARTGRPDPVNCNQYVGLEFDQFLTSCLSDPGSGGDPNILSRSGTLWEKLTGGSTHDVENVYFNLVGINMSWTDENVEAPNSQLVVQDNYLPTKGDFATDFEFDVRTDSVPDNDNATIQMTPAGTLRGSGLVQREWARLTQLDMNAKLAAQAIAQGNPAKAALYTHTIGDPACRVPQAQAFAAGCTGFEGYAIGGTPEASDNGDGCATPTYTGGACAASPCFGNICDNIENAGLFAAQYYGYGGYGSSSLTPGDPTSYFCQDPSQALSLQGSCVDGPVWTNALQAVTNVAGFGNAKLLPFDLQDRRYYFRWWGIAMIKYYEAYGRTPGLAGVNKACTTLPSTTDPSQSVSAACVAQMPIDLASLFFDNNYGAGFDKDEYIDRSVMQGSDIITSGPNPGLSPLPMHIYAQNALKGPGPAELPIDFNYGSDTIAANQRYSDWFRRMDREEAGMFKAMLVDKSNLAGGENWVNITNLAGSPLLSANYASYECATQWPNVTIVGNGTPASPMINNALWTAVCATTCPAAPLLYPNNCPYPPGVGPAGNPAAPLEMDQNGALAGCSDPSLATPGCKGYNNSTITAQPRLFAYPSIWGGTGAACPNSGPKGDLENNSYADNSMSNCNGGACANPYQGGCAFGTVANLQGSVFKVGSSDSNNARIGYVPYAGHPDGTDNELLLAYVNLPNMRNPFNSNMDAKIVSGGNPLGSGYVPPLAGAAGSIVVSVPWTPNIDGVGFNIPTSGTTDKFVQTAQLDFTGVLETYLLDVVPWTDPTTGAPTPDHTLKIEAIEGDDFLGEVFLCQDTGTSGGTAGDVLGTQDLLGLHMYDSGLAVLDWLSKHPGLQDSCNIIIQYSQYNNYLDYITSISAGVTVGISQGSGYGRITSVQIFDPSIAAIP